MATYQITQTRTGTDVGTYDGATEAEVLDAMARDQGYDDHVDMLATIGAKGMGELDVAEMNAAHATIVETGNGFPNVGDYVRGEDCLYRVVRAGSRIETGRPGDGNVCRGYLLEEADWDDCAEGDEHVCSVVLTERS